MLARQPPLPLGCAAAVTTARHSGRLGVMATSTTVSVYEVDASGQTGANLGTGSLIDPRLVLVHPPLSKLLASAGVGVSLRVGIGADDLVEVIDVRGVHVDLEQDDQPLVAIALKRSASAATEILELTDETLPSLRRAALAHLSGLCEQPERLPQPDEQGAPWCTLWHAWFC